MNDYLSAILGLFFSEKNQLWLMFASSFLSATLLPGNSEAIFSGFAVQSLAKQDNHQLIWLFFVATLGNSLGSVTTYLLAFFIPSPDKFRLQRKSAQWALNFTQKYGVWVLLLSWLPAVGDLFCGLAGWLRLNFLISLLLILIGKAARYAVILWSIYAILS